jgi:hypothetical protein
MKETPLLEETKLSSGPTRETETNAVGGCLKPIIPLINPPNSESGAKKNTSPKIKITIRNKPQTTDKNLPLSIKENKWKEV